MIDLCSKYSLAFNIIFILFFHTINEEDIKILSIEIEIYCQQYNKDNKPKDIEDNYNKIGCII